MTDARPLPTAAPSVRPDDAGRRPVVRRMLLPRGRDAVFKWLFLPAGAAVAASVAGRPPGPDDLVHLALLWLVAEQLLYQARYLVNDLRDRHVDALHPAQGRKSRLGAHLSGRQLGALRASVVVRVALAVLVTATLLPGEFRESAAAFALLLVPVSSAYELARERVRRDDVDPRDPRVRGLGVPVLLAVPLGYGLRVGVGYHCLAPADDPWWHLALVVGTTMLLQSATVALSWALEGTSFLDASLAGHHPRLRGVAHIALLVRHAGLLDAGRTGVPARTLIVARDRPAAGTLDVRGWDVAAGVAVLAAFVGAVVPLRTEPAAVAVGVLAGLAVVAAAPVVHRAGRTSPPVPTALPWAPWLRVGDLAVLVGVEVAVWTAGLVALAVVHPAGLVLWWVPAVVMLHWGFARASSYDRGYGPLSPAKRVARWSADRFVGARDVATGPTRS